MEQGGGLRIDFPIIMSECEGAVVSNCYAKRVVEEEEPQESYEYFPQNGRRNE